MQKIPFYKNGLRFSCTECGKCCTGSPGYVWLTEEDIKKIVAFLAISKEEFLKKYTRNVNGRISLLEKAVSYDCIFLKDKKCLIYSSRPKQCSDYPFWPENLKSKESWENQKRYCEGIHDEAQLIPFEEIKKILPSK